MELQNSIEQYMHAHFTSTCFSILHLFHKTKLHLLCKDGNCCDISVSYVEDMTMQNYFVTHGFVNIFLGYR